MDPTPYALAGLAVIDAYVLARRGLNIALPRDAAEFKLSERTNKLIKEGDALRDRFEPR